ncbi:hypothetical protein DDV93_03300 [Cereibacter johrii]|nr:hypothetical protein DDV93_03300 [Cereibacter johrii]
MPVATACPEADGTRTIAGSERLTLEGPDGTTHVVPFGGRLQASALIVSALPLGRPTEDDPGKDAGAAPVRRRLCRVWAALLSLAASPRGGCR